MSRKLWVTYVSITCYNGRACVDFGALVPDRGFKIRRVSGPTTRFSNLVVDLNNRLLCGRGRVALYAQGWCFYPNRTRGRA